MPELVEVETTKKDLSKIIEGRVIKKVSVFLDKIVENNNDEFINKIENNMVKKVKRRGKWLLFELDKYSIIIHFKMEGRFYLYDLGSKRQIHDYVIFDFDTFSLHYNDPRLFGKMLVIENDRVDDFFKEKKLGLEYDDPNLSVSYLKDKFKTHHIEIKKLLLDQRFITGIGNIYADEILFESKINPKQISDKLTNKDLDNIIKNTKIVFEKALTYNGTYPNIYKVRGTFENVLKVHMRRNVPCVNCGTKIVKEDVGNRGTYYCPKCQKIK